MAVGYSRIMVLHYENCLIKSKDQDKERAEILKPQIEISVAVVVKGSPKLTLKVLVMMTLPLETGF